MTLIIKNQFKFLKVQILTWNLWEMTTEAQITQKWSKIIIKTKKNQEIILVKFQVQIF